MAKKTNVSDFMGSLGAGVVEQIMGSILTDTATAVLVKEGKATGEVNLKLTFAKMGEETNTAVKVTSKLSFKRPTSKGSSSEDLSYESIHYVDPLTGLVDTPPKRRDEAQHQNASMNTAMPSGQRNS